MQIFGSLKFSTAPECLTLLGQVSKKCRQPKQAQHGTHFDRSMLQKNISKSLRNMKHSITQYMILDLVLKNFKWCMKLGDGLCLIDRIKLQSTKQECWLAVIEKDKYDDHVHVTELDMFSLQDHNFKHYGRMTENM